MRKLKAEEIECRVNTINKKGCSLLLYKDARVDMKMLDEEFGEMCWQRRHKSIDGNLYCEISVYDHDKCCWISKEDVGTESYTEKEKGQASDSFKRAGTNWGIGRELYTAPFIWISASDVNLEEKDGKYKTYDHFTLKDIQYDDDQISALEIVNDKLKRVVYTYGKLTVNDEKHRTSYKPAVTPSKTDKDSPATTAQVDQIKSICGEQSVPVDFILNNYSVSSLDELTRIQAYSVVNSWDKVKESYKNSLEGIPFK